MITIEREKLEQVLGALEATIDVPCYGGHPKQEAAAAAIKEALAQPSQEPVAWIGDDGNLYHDYEKPHEDYGPEPTPLYTTPPQRPWVGLTDEQYDEIWRMDLNNRELMDATIAALKENNT